MSAPMCTIYPHFYAAANKGLGNDPSYPARARRSPGEEDDMS